MSHINYPEFFQPAVPATNICGTELNYLSWGDPWRLQASPRGHWLPLSKFSAPSAEKWRTRFPLRFSLSTALRMSNPIQLLWHYLCKSGPRGAAADGESHAPRGRDLPQRHMEILYTLTTHFHPLPAPHVMFTMHLLCVKHCASI